MLYEVSADHTAFIFRVKLSKQSVLNPKDEDNSILRKKKHRKLLAQTNGVTFEKAWIFKVILNLLSATSSR